MRRFVGRWVALLVVVTVFGALFVKLGFWQLDRLEERRATNTVLVGHENASPIPWTDVFTKPITDADAWQRVSATGTFDADHQFIVRYRSSATGPGYEIVTPLRTASGTVLVDRGFVVKPAGEDFPSVAPAPPSGPVTVMGYVRRDEQGDTGAVDPIGNSVRLVNSEAIGRTLPYPITNGYIGLLTVTPAQEGKFVPVDTPEISDGPHFWYAVQWFMFAAFAFVGWFAMVRKDIVESRRAPRVTEAAAEEEDPHGSAPD